MTVADADPAAAVVASGRHLAGAGLAPGASGNVSVRCAAEYLVTPTGTRLAALDPRRLARLAVDGRPVAGDPPSKEWPLHLAVYERRPDAGAIVHLHSPAAVAVACLDDVDSADVLPTYTAYRVMRIGRIPLVPYRPPGDPELAALTGAEAGEAGRGLLLANHGLVAWGRDLDEAVGVAEEIESAADLHLRLRGLPARLLTPADVAELRRRFG